MKTTITEAQQRLTIFCSHWSHWFFESTVSSWLGRIKSTVWSRVNCVESSQLCRFESTVSSPVESTTIHDGTFNWLAPSIDWSINDGTWHDGTFMTVPLIDSWNWIDPWWHLLHPWWFVHLLDVQSTFWIHVVPSQSMGHLHVEPWWHRGVIGALWMHCVLYVCISTPEKRGVVSFFTPSFLTAYFATLGECWMPSARVARYAVKVVEVISAAISLYDILGWEFDKPWDTNSGVTLL